MLTNSKLHQNKKNYTIAELEQNIYHLGLWDILQTQVLTANFCFTYFWSSDDEYAKDEEDKEICEHDILYWQPHLTKAELYSCDVYMARLKKNS